MARVKIKISISMTLGQYLGLQDLTLYSQLQYDNAIVAWRM